jgi:thiol-disulfide isomerase/thioredoxin
MSQVPTDENNIEAMQDPESAFRQHLDRLNELIKDGGSLSGRERNCAFLNMGDGQFATVSSVSGLDFKDDARSPAAVGDLDLWVANRTAPQMRFLRNDALHENHFVALRLVGTSCNRDAIGARVELTLVGQESQPLVKTLMAGDGFLSQSSKWLHFGLGKATDIQSLIVRWPGCEAEEIQDVQADGWFRVEQGKGAERVERKRIEFAGPVTSAPVSNAPATRIVTSSRTPLPPLRYKSYEGATQDILLGKQQPVLINLWASWCQPCIEELTAWKAEAGRLAEKGIHVVVLSVDDVDEVEASSSSTSRKILDRLNLPFDLGIVTPELFLRLEQSHNWPFRRRIPMAIPTSLLVDGQGRLTVIYRGPVSAQQVIDDSALFQKSQADLVDLALPFAGRWHARTKPALPMATGIRLMDEGDVADASEFIRRNHELLRPHREYPLLAVWVGQELIEAGEVASGGDFLALAAKSNSRDLTVLNNLAWQYAASPHAELRNPVDAVRFASRANQISGGKSEHILATLAVAQASDGKFESAIKSATRAAEIAREKGNVSLLQKQMERIELFKKRKPFREPAKNGG